MLTVFSLISDGLGSVPCPKFGNEMKKNWKEFFECIEIRSKNDEFTCQQMIQVFKKIQLVHSAVQDVVHDCPDYKVFQKEFIGSKLAKEIQTEIDQTYTYRNRYRYPQSFFTWMQSKVQNLIYYKYHLKSQEEEDWPPNYICDDCGIDCHRGLIRKTRDTIQGFQRELQDGIEKEFNAILQALKEAQKKEELDKQTKLGPGMGDCSILTRLVKWISFGFHLTNYFWKRNIQLALRKVLIEGMACQLPSS